VLIAWLWFVGIAYLDVALTWPSFLARAARRPSPAVTRKFGPPAG
jgi:hypothetical protein